MCSGTRFFTTEKVHFTDTYRPNGFRSILCAKAKHHFAWEVDEDRASNTQLGVYRKGFWAHYSLLHSNPNKRLVSDVFIHSLMRMSSSLLLGLVAISFGVSQESKARPSVTRVYGGNDFENYALDPPYWSYHPRGFGHSKSAHWLYKNHRYVFIDIKLNYADSRSLPPD